MKTFLRCPLCLMPIGRFGFGESYQPIGGGKPIPYQLCRSCAGNIAGASEPERADLLSRVELFFERKGI